MTTERINIIIREDGSVVVRRNLDGMGQAAAGADRALQFMKRTLGAIGFGIAAREVLRMIDAYTLLQNRLRGVGLEGQVLSAVYDQLLASANATRSTLSGTIEIYSRLALNSRELGVSQQELIAFTTSLNQAIILSGASIQEAQGALIQFSQGMASGTLRGDELRSVLEQLPAVADVIAKQLGVTRGELRKLGAEGKITSQQILIAFQKAAPGLEAAFAKTIPTMSQALQVLKNSATDFFGRLGVSSGLVDAVSTSLIFLSKNLDNAADAFVRFSIVLAATAASYLVLKLALAASAVSAAGGAVALLSAAFATLLSYLARFAVFVIANPFTILAIAIISVVALFAGFGDKINAGIDSITTLQDVAKAFGEAVIPIFKSVGESLGEGYDEVATGIKVVLGTITGLTGQAVDEWLGTYVAFYADVGTGFAGVMRGIAKTLDATAGLITGVLIGIGRAFTGLPAIFDNIFSRVYNVVIAIVQALINKVLEGVNKLRAYVGKDPIELVKFEAKAVDAAAFEKYGENIAESITAGFEAQGGFMLTRVNEIFDRAGEIAKNSLRDKLRAMEGSAGVDLTTKGKPIPIKQDDKEKLKAESALRSLLNTIIPSQGATLELAKAERVLNEAVKEGAIKRPEANRYLAIAKEYYADLQDPMRKVNREIEEETRLLGMSARAREVENIVLNQQRAMKQAGIPLDDEATKALRAKLTAQQAFAEQVKAQDQLLAQSVETRREFVTQLNAIQALLGDPTKGFGKGDAAIATMAAAPELFAGTQVALDAQEAAFANMYAKIDQYRQLDVANQTAADQAKSLLDVQYTEFKLQTTQAMFANLATLSSSSNKKIAALGRAAAVAQATIDGILAVQKALGAAPPPWNYALAATVGIAAAANVAKLSGIGFEQGGYTGNMGTSTVAGVVHGQEFVTNARATALNRPALEAMNRGEKIGGNITIENSPTINIDARADRSDIMRNVQAALTTSNAQLVDKLQRSRMLPN